jgi:hypothetical protein
MNELERILKEVIIPEFAWRGREKLQKPLA